MAVASLFFAVADDHDEAVVVVTVGVVVADEAAVVAAVAAPVVGVAVVVVEAAIVVAVATIVVAVVTLVSAVAVGSDETVVVVAVGVVVIGEAAVVVAIATLIFAEADIFVTAVIKKAVRAKCFRSSHLKIKAIQINVIIDECLFVGGSNATDETGILHGCLHGTYISNFGDHILVNVSSRYILKQFEQK